MSGVVQLDTCVIVFVYLCYCVLYWRTLRSDLRHPRTTNCPIIINGKIEWSEFSENKQIWL